MRPQPVDHDIKVWLSAETYLSVRAIAEQEAEGEAPSISRYVRRLIRADLARRASAMQAAADRDEAAPNRSDPDRTGTDA